VQHPATAGGLDALVPTAWSAGRPLDAVAADDRAEDDSSGEEHDDDQAAAQRHGPGPLFASVAGGPGTEAQALLSSLVDVPAKRGLMQLRTALMEAIGRARLADRRPRLMGAVTMAQLRQLQAPFVHGRERPLAGVAGAHLPLLQWTSAALAATEARCAHGACLLPSLVSAAHEAHEDGCGECAARRGIGTNTTPPKRCCC
jgi:hypothetical protein